MKLFIDLDFGVLFFYVGIGYSVFLAIYIDIAYIAMVLMFSVFLLMSVLTDICDRICEAISKK